MKIKIYLLSIFLGLFILVGCKQPTEPTTTPTNPEVVEPENPNNPVEPVITEIYVKENKDYFVGLGKEFRTNGITIFAKYSNNTEVDITKDVSFSNIDTSTGGEKELVITYKEYSVKIKVFVLLPIDVEIDTEDAFVLYEVGQTINLSNLGVYDVYDGIKYEADKFMVKIIDPDGLEVSNVVLPLEKIGKYTVKIISNNYEASYNIEVVSELPDVPTQDLPTNETPDSGTVPPTEDTGDVESYTAIELDTTNVKTSFNEEVFNFENLKVYAIKDDGSKEELQSTDYNVYLMYDGSSTNKFRKPGDYTVKVSYKGSLEILDKNASYDIEYITKDYVTFGYSGPGAGDYESFTVEMNEDNPLLCATVPNGYYITGFSHYYDEWVEESYDSLVKIYISQIQNGKKYLVLFSKPDSEYGPFDGIVKEFNDNQNVTRASVTEVPETSPDGMKFSHWDMPGTFNISHNMYVTPVYVPETLNTNILTVEETVYNISANSIDVSVQNFVDATPEGYELESLTLSLNGEIIQTIPYEKGMLGAYFDDLTANTNYEVGAYYSQIQQNMSLRKSRQLTYRFHFVGFMVLTTSDVKYRVRMMYDGDCLYRWYFAPDTNVSNHDFYFSFQLPIEYDGYTVVGSKNKVGVLTGNFDLEAELIPPAGDKCTVVFYDKDYCFSYGSQLTILKIETVNKGSSATAPTVENEYYEGSIRYRFVGWSHSYNNVTGNVLTCPMYERVVEGFYQAVMNMTIGDTYFSVYGELIQDYSIWICYRYNLYEVATNKEVKTGYFTELHPTNVTLVEGLKPNTKYKISFELDKSRYQNVTVVFDLDGFEFTTRIGNETTGYNYNVRTTSCTIEITCLDAQVTEFVSYTKGSNGERKNQSVVSSAMSMCKHNSTYYFSPILNTNTANGRVKLAYFDEIVAKTKDAVKPTITGGNIQIEQGSFTATIDINDPSIIVVTISLCYRVTDLNKYKTVYIRFDRDTSISVSKTIDLSTIDPETNETKYYQINDAYYEIEYIYNGSYQKLRKQFTVS